MRGTDCTPGQLNAADRFLESVVKWPSSRGEALVRRDEIVRLVAWYGALRYIAARDGVGGTLDEPGIVDSLDT